MAPNQYSAGILKQLMGLQVGFLIKFKQYNLHDKVMWLYASLFTKMKINCMTSSKTKIIKLEDQSLMYFQDAPSTHTQYIIGT